ncbi:hypothetical protein CENSYa_0565 [Cenarchaeum symbiosum A]|uniref:HYR domain-containing protein n=1 Tax=Cenarchaeum symbiosum (strain A) TaxID=414004 RepID=A0RV31_CENSY|nr:hypothetical protein CENSYa_0565 [Cenarchaeum symbiosum A]
MSPQGVAAGPDGSVYVTDLGNMRVQKFDDSGAFLLQWGGQGIANGSFKSPEGIAVGENHTVYVVDGQLNRVQAFTPEGEFLFGWGTQGSNSGEFLLPRGIAADPGGDIYVADTGNHRIQRFTPDGGYVSEIVGSSGSGFISPAGLAAAGNGTVYVTFAGGNAIEKYGGTGELLSRYDSSVGGRPIRAHGLEADPEGNLYVADTGNDRILRLDANGEAISVWGSSGSDGGMFKMPQDLALGPDNSLYVVDANGHRVQKFGTPLQAQPVQDEPAKDPAQGAPAQGGPVQGAPAQGAAPVSGDLTKPVITPPNDLFIEATGALTPVNVGRATATDASGITSLTHNTPGEFTLGTSTVIWTAIDGAGNIAVATQSVTVSDTTPPVIDGIGGVAVEAAGTGGNTIDLGTPGVSDAVGVLSLENDAPQNYPLGKTVVTWTARDIAGNEASVQQEVSVVDSTPPAVSAPPAITIEASSPGATEAFLGAPGVTDNGEIISISNDAPAGFALGNTTVTWLASDSSGNTASDVQLVTVIDTTPPAISPPRDITSEASSQGTNSVDIGSPDVSDVQAVEVSSNAPALFPMGETVVIWTATDASGNNASAVQRVTIVDTIPPLVAVPADVTAEATGPGGAEAGLGEVTVSDVSAISSIDNDAPASFPIGETVVTWTVRDAHGNIQAALQTISIVDTTPPSVIPPRDIIIEAASAEGAHADPGLPTVNDIVGVHAVDSDAPEMYPVGMTTITWSAADAAGNTATATQAVTVVDSTAPVVEAPSDVTAEAAGPDGAAAETGEASASDATGISSTSSDAPAIFPLGTTEVTWTAADNHGNTAQDIQAVTILDTTSPVISAPPDISIEAAGPGPEAADIGVADAGDLVGVSYMQNDAPAAYPLGTTEVTWTATDDAGNSASAVQKITVYDTIPPVVLAPADVSAEAESAAGAAVRLIGVNASDAVGVVSVSSDAPEIFPLGETVVTWTASDEAGNTAADTQLVTISDTTPPSITAPRSVLAEATGAESSVDYGSAASADEVGVTSVYNDAPAVFPLGLTTVTWTAEDAAGNSKSAVQQVSVVDTTPPEISAPEDLVLEAENDGGGKAQLGEAAADDLVLLESIENDAPGTFPIGETEVTWTATDSSQNTATAVQLVTVGDTVPPGITAPADITAEAEGPRGSAVPLGVPEASDTAGSVAVSNNAPSIFPIGETEVTWTASDDAGNTASDVQQVTVLDTIPPELALPADVEAEALSPSGNVVDTGEAAAEDLVGVLSIESDAPELFPYGETVITWTAVDDAGNTVSGEQTISVIDTTAPSVVAPPDVEMEAASAAGNPVDTGTATAEDTVGVASLESDAPAEFTLGDTLVTWTATDADGNSASDVQRVVIVDTTAPEITPPPDVEVEASSMETEVEIVAATALDLVDPAPSVAGDARGLFPLGSTNVTWTASDMFGNEASTVQVVTVLACGRPAEYYNLIEGTHDNDILQGTSQADLVFALGGDDIISGAGGNDCIFGGDGDDIILGGGGDDTLSGGGGNDIIRGHSGVDAITGGGGADIADGGDDRDTCGIEPDDTAVKCEA